MSGLGCLSSNLRVNNIEIGRVISKRHGIRTRYGLDNMVCSAEGEIRFPSLALQIICHEKIVYASVTKDEHAIDAGGIFLEGWGVCGGFNFFCPAGFSKFIIWFVRRKYKKIKVGIPINKRIPKITGLDMYTMR
mgnify:CR=1 FL=1